MAINMNKNLCLLSIFVVLIISISSANALSINTKENNIQPTSNQFFSPGQNIPAETYLKSDGSQITETDVKIKKEIQIKGDGAFNSCPSNNNGFNLAIVYLDFYYAQYDQNTVYLIWDIVVKNIGDEYTFSTSEVKCDLIFDFNFGDQRDYSLNMRSVTFDNPDDSPIIWESGMGDIGGSILSINPSNGKPETITAKYEISYPQNPDVNPNDNIQTKYLPYGILADYKVVNITSIPVKDAKVLYSYENEYFSSGVSTSSDKKGEGLLSFPPIDPYSSAFTYELEASKNNKKQLKTTDPVKEGDTFDIDFELDVQGYKVKSRSNRHFFSYEKLSQLLQAFPLFSKILKLL